MLQDRVGGLAFGLIVGLGFGIMFGGAYGPLHLMRGDVISGVGCILIPLAFLAVLAGYLRESERRDRWLILASGALVYLVGLEVGIVSGLLRGALQ